MVSLPSYQLAEICNETCPRGEFCHLIICHLFCYSTSVSLCMWSGYRCDCRTQVQRTRLNCREEWDGAMEWKEREHFRKNLSRRILSAQILSLPISVSLQPSLSVYLHLSLSLSFAAANQFFQCKKKGFLSVFLLCVSFLSSDCSQRLQFFPPSLLQFESMTDWVAFSVSFQRCCRLVSAF